MIDGFRKKIFTVVIIFIGSFASFLMFSAFHFDISVKTSKSGLLQNMTSGDTMTTSNAFEWIEKNNL